MIEKNAAYYDAVREQNHALVGHEGFVKGSVDHDLRTKVDPTAGTVGEAIGQVLSRINGIWHCGTGSLIQFDGLNGSRIITCAHNLVQFDKINGSQYRADSIYFYPGSTRNVRPKQLRVTNFHIHQKYFNKDCNNFYSGYDLAVMEFTTDQVLPLTPLQNVFWGRYDDKMKSYRARVYGYPGENNLSGDPYEMYGTIDKVAMDNRVITYKDIDTTGGQSGSPVFVQDPVNNNWILIGIHTGINISCNVATLLSHENFRWVESMFSLVSSP